MSSFRIDGWTNSRENEKLTIANKQLGKFMYHPELRLNQSPDPSFVDQTAGPGQELSHGPRRTDRLEQLEAQVAQLLERMTIAVVYGGNKKTPGAVINQTSNPRAWKSYQEVGQDIADSLRRLGSKRVCLVPEDIRLASRLREERVDLVWLNTGGVQGYNPMSHAAAVMEMSGIPYVGHDPLTASTLDNKHVFKRQLQALGIPTLPFLTWHHSRGPFSAESHENFAATFGDYSGPFVVKPVCGRASLHVQVVDHLSQLPEAVETTYRATENHVLIEAFLSGREFTVAVSGHVSARGRRLVRHHDPFTFSFIERNFDSNERIFTSMDLRPITAKRMHLLDPSRDGQIWREIEEIARRVFVETDLDSFIRLDLRMNAEDRLFVIEANPKPDLKFPTEERTSIVCMGLPAHGMDYDDLILSILADRIDLLFCQRRNSVHALASLLD